MLYKYFRYLYMIINKSLINSYIFNTNMYSQKFADNLGNLTYLT